MWNQRGDNDAARRVQAEGKKETVVKNMLLCDWHMAARPLLLMSSTTAIAIHPLEWSVIQSV